MEAVTSNVTSPCVVCGEPTALACLDCAKDLGKVIHVCARASCCADHLLVEQTLRALSASVRGKEVPTG